MLNVFPSYLCGAWSSRTSVAHSPLELAYVFILNRQCTLSPLSCGVRLPCEHTQQCFPLRLAWHIFLASLCGTLSLKLALRVFPQTCAVHFLQTCVAHFPCEPSWHSVLSNLSGSFFVEICVLRFPFNSASCFSFQNLYCAFPC
jgi:hypothetical protein